MNMAAVTGFLQQFNPVAAPAEKGENGVRAHDATKQTLVSTVSRDAVANAILHAVPGATVAALTGDVTQVAASTSTLFVASQTAQASSRAIEFRSSPERKDPTKEADGEQVPVGRVRDWSSRALSGLSKVATGAALMVRGNSIAQGAGVADAAGSAANTGVTHVLGMALKDEVAGSLAAWVVPAGSAGVSGLLYLASKRCEENSFMAQALRQGAALNALQTVGSVLNTSYTTQAVGHGVAVLTSCGWVPVACAAAAAGAALYAVSRAEPATNKAE